MQSEKSATTTKLGYEHYVCYPDDGYRHEIIDGAHYMSPAPSPYHQAVSRRIQFQLYTAIELTKRGVVINAPIDVQLSEFDIVQPDLVIVLKQNRIITPIKVKGAPDLVVEILSPTTKKNDLVLKRGRYETTGVSEYWIVDPFEQTLLQLVLSERGYQEQLCTDRVTTAFQPPVTVDLLQVWGDDT
jgi:Uma2 family endonuclease